MQVLAQSILDQAFGYEAYERRIEALLAEHHQANPEQLDELIHYTRMNLIRMERLDKTGRIMAATRLKLAKAPAMLWLAITEGWCGDAAQVLPIINKMALLNPAVQFKLLYRDQHPELMDAFLTNGKRAIPVVVLVNPNTLEILGHWGPRPAELQNYVLGEVARIREVSDAKEHKRQMDEMHTQVQRWYAKDKTYSTQQEFLAAVHQAFGF